MPSRAPRPTPSTLVVDVGLARRVEGALAASARLYAERQQGRAIAAGDDDDGDRERAAYLDVGGGVAVYGGPHAGPNVGRLWGIGLAGPVQDEELDRAEEFYRARRRPAQVMLCPLADVGLLPTLVARGYQPVRFDTVLAARPRDVVDASKPVDDGLVVRPASEGEWGSIWEVARVAYGLDAVGEPRALAMNRPMFEPPTRMFLVERAGRAVALGVVVPTPGGIAHYMGAGVVPDARGGRLQRLLIDVRARYAEAEGQDLLVATCAPVGPSFRNLTEAGFSPLYTALLLEKKLATDLEQDVA